MQMKLVHRREGGNLTLGFELIKKKHNSPFVLSIYLFLCVEDVLDVLVFHVVSEKGLLKLNVP